MKLISWNVNGIRATTGKLKNGEKKGGPTNNTIKTLMEEQQPDILCLQEVKTQSEGDLAWLKTHFPHLYTNFATLKKGYSGVALLTKEEPEWVSYGFSEYPEEVIGAYNDKEFSYEGRIISAKFKEYLVVTVYTPNAQPELARIQERTAWEQVLRMYLIELEEEYKVPVILCGDLNCTHTDMDIYNPKMHKNTPGVSKQEREELQLTLDAGFVDSFRYLKPEEQKYTYWSNFHNARERNMGWRIDYVLVSCSAVHQIISADCLTEYYGSDHCPVSMELNVIADDSDI